MGFTGSGSAMPLSSELRIDVLNAYQELINQFSQLNQAMQQDHALVAWLHHLPPYFPRHDQNRHTRDLAYQLIHQIEYLDSQDPREILVCPGFIGASTETLSCVQSLNDAKNAFKEAILRLKEAKLSIKDKKLNQDLEQLLNHRDFNTSRALNRMGLSRLHLKQCYRRIPILPAAPKKISWTWAHTRSIKRISVEQATSLLQKKSNQDQGIQQQLSKLSCLSSNEPLAIVQELAPHLRANIVLPDEAGPKTRIMVKGPIPLFFPATTTTPAPDFKPPIEKQSKNKNRLVRKDVRLDPEPFLPAIRAHRYVVHDTQKEDTNLVD